MIIGEFTRSQKEGNFAMDLKSLSLDQLKDLQRDVDKAIKSFEARRLAEARKELEQKARELGVSLNEILGVQGKKGVKSLPKYRHPEDPTLTWAGRGRKPVWFIEAIASGKSADDLRI
jgi:DNA-binding protein H-NS